MSGSTRLTGGRVVTPSGVIESDVIVVDGVIDRVVVSETGAAPIDDWIDIPGCLVAPGFIDVQINGGWGHDFTSDPTSIGSVASRLPATGVTAFLPTIVTAPADVRRSAIDALRACERIAGSATPLGLHFEGPMISADRSGAHDVRWIAVPDADERAGWARADGIAMVTLAPEVVGRDVVRELVVAGVVVSAGHSQCSADQFAEARAAGVTMVTHLFNAMGPFSHRGPGLIGAALADSPFVGLICDGIHVDPVAVRAAWRALGVERTILVTDAMAALGLDATSTRLGDVEVSIDETGVRTPDGILAGSNLSLDQAVRNLVAFAGCSPHDALRTVTLNPARLLGLDDRGTVESGARADLVVLDPKLRVRLTMIGGEVAWRS